MDNLIKRIQTELCEKYSAVPYPVSDDQRVGISWNVRDGVLPLNGMRIEPEGNSCGWYIWAGEELSDAPNFFVSLHVSHLKEWSPEILRFLSLPPGWRFLVAGDYVDVWQDDQLLAHLG